MDVADVLVDAFDRVRDSVAGVVSGLSSDDLAWRADGDANSIAWLIWHLTRIQDDHVAHVAGVEQVWPAWADRFALRFDLRDTGYGHSSDDVAAVRASADLLTNYHESVYNATVEYLNALTTSDLDRIVDTRWDPPVTLGVRLVSVIADDLEHVGQAAFVRGLLDRRSG
jgi:hypothetical protein